MQVDLGWDIAPCLLDVCFLSAALLPHKVEQYAEERVLETQIGD